MGQYLFYVFNLHKKGRKKEQKGKEEIHIFIYIFCAVFYALTSDSGEQGK